MNLRHPISIAVPVLLGVFILSGCPPKKPLPIEELPPIEEVREEEEDLDAIPMAEQVRVGQDWSQIDPLRIVPFEYDSAGIGAQARGILRENVAVIRKLPNTVTVRVEGHCDDRGTIEYNIALGQRRANAVRDFYVTAGIARNRIETISYGEERPLCRQQTEDCWTRNRRGVTTVRNAAPLILRRSELQ